MTSIQVTVQVALVFTVCACRAAYLFPSSRQSSSNQMSNPSTFMDPSFSVGGQGNSQTQDQSIMQSLSLGIVRSQAQGQGVQNPPLGSRTKDQTFLPQGGGNGNFQTQAQNQPGLPSQSATMTNGSPQSDNLSRAPEDPSGTQSRQPTGPTFSKDTATQTLGSGSNYPSTSNVIRAKEDNQVSVEQASAGIQQTVSGNNMFNPGNLNSLLVAPPGTGDSQFNNNIGSQYSMINKFGGGGLSVDASQFFNPRRNPDGSISGAAGNADGPPMMGPGLVQSGGSISNSNDYNSMFGPPNFFMNPGASFGTK